jgi:transposase
MARPKPWEVDDELWAAIQPLLPRVQRRARHPGRKRHPDRLVFQGILFVLHTGIAWEHLPQELGYRSGMATLDEAHASTVAVQAEAAVLNRGERLLCSGKPRIYLVVGRPDGADQFHEGVQLLPADVQAQLSSETSWYGMLSCHQKRIR